MLDLSQQSDKISVSNYIARQENFDLSSKVTQKSFLSSKTNNLKIEEEVNKSLREIEIENDEVIWSTSEIKHKLLKDLSKLLKEGNNVTIKDVYVACSQYYNNCTKKFKAPLGQLLSELEIAISLTNTEKLTSEVDFGVKNGGKLEMPWHNAGWLVALQDKHPLQWALEENHKLASKEQTETKSKNYIKIKVAKQEHNLLSYAAENNITIFTRDRKRISALQWAIENDLKISSDQTAAEFVQGVNNMADQRLLVLVSAASKGQEELDKVIDDAIRNPYNIDCHEAARYLLLNNDQYLNILPKEAIHRLCNKSKLDKPKILP